METDEWSTKDPSLELTKPALEIWALYSYNLHKATYEGLNALESRKGKRNFIIGRGSFAGAHKWAGLWTGDNASTWDHFRISVCQVCATTECVLGNRLIAYIGACAWYFGQRNCWCRRRRIHARRRFLRQGAKIRRAGVVDPLVLRILYASMVPVSSTSIVKRELSSIFTE